MYYRFEKYRTSIDNKIGYCRQAIRNSLISSANSRSVLRKQVKPYSIEYELLDEMVQNLVCEICDFNVEDDFTEKEMETIQTIIGKNLLLVAFDSKYDNWEKGTSIFDSQLLSQTNTIGIIKTTDNDIIFFEIHVPLFIDYPSYDKKGKICYMKHNSNKVDIRDETCNQQLIIHSNDSNQLFTFGKLMEIGKKGYPCFLNKSFGQHCEITFDPTVFFRIKRFIVYYVQISCNQQ